MTRDQILKQVASARAVRNAALASVGREYESAMAKLQRECGALGHVIAEPHSVFARALALCGGECLACGFEQKMEAVCVVHRTGIKVLKKKARK